MTELMNLVWFVLMIPVLLILLQIVNEKSELQIIISFISILISGISYELFWQNNFSNTLMLWWLIIWAIWFKRFFKQIRF